jgi:hypothetical protein
VDWLSTCQQEQGSLSLFEKLVAFAKKHQILLINDNHQFFLNPDEFVAG